MKTAPMSAAEVSARPLPPTPRGAEAARPPLSYLPFGAGPRFCVGAAFAQLDVWAVLAYLLQRFDLAAGPGHVSGEMGATLTPHPAVRLAVTRLKPAWPGG